MTRTANATYPMKIACLIEMAAAAGHPFICQECGKPILPGHAVQFDHRQAVGRGGENRPKDLAPLHAAKRGTEDSLGNSLDCHDRKTFRPRSGATTLGGDNYEAKKTPRLSAKHAVNKALPEETQKFVVEKPALRTALERQMKHGAGRSPIQAGTGFSSRSIPSRKFPTKQRGFAPRGSRPFNRKRRA